MAEVGARRITPGAWGRIANSLQVVDETLITPASGVDFLTEPKRQKGAIA